MKNTKTKVNNIFYSLLIFGDFLFYLTQNCLDFSKNSAWISVILMAVISTVLLFILNVAVKKADTINSTLLNKMFILCLGAFSYIKASLFLATASESISTYFYRQSPADFILLLLCIGCFFCLVTEKRAVVTAGGIVATAVLFFILLMVITASPDFEFYGIFPVFGEGNIKSFISLPFVYSLANIVFFYRDNLGKKPTRPILYAGVTGAVLLLGIVLIKPYQLLGESFPNTVFELSSLASLGILFKKFEIILLALWVLCALAVCGYFSYTALGCVKSMLALKDKKGIAGMHIIAVYGLGNLFLKLDTAIVYSYVSALFFAFSVICLAVIIIKLIFKFKGGNKNEVY